MFHVYLIKSLKDDSIYIGYTDNIKKRLIKHNQGEVNYTSKHKPFKLIYLESYLSEKDARKREYKLKHNGGQRDFLKENLKDSLSM